MLQRISLQSQLTIDPTSTQPAEGEHNIIKNDECNSRPVCGSGGVRYGGEADVDDHANAAAKSTPKHHGATTKLLDEPDGRIRSDGEDGVHDACKYTGEHLRVAQVGEDLRREVDKHVDALYLH